MPKCWYDDFLRVIEPDAGFRMEKILLFIQHRCASFYETGSYELIGWRWSFTMFKQKELATHNPM